ncbi:MAG: PhzF family phenazine biosynthesis protein [Nevskia sp.]
MTLSGLRFHTLDVFTTQRHGGNPLAVVLEADNLDPREMQCIAREFNLSETVFVQQATQPGALVKLRIFTPSQELPFAGHPTIGTACLLAGLGLAPAGEEVRFVFEENVGPVPMRVTRRAGEPPFAQLAVARLPEYGPPAPPAALLARILGLDVDAIPEAGPGPRIVSCGLPFLLVPLRAPELLAGIEVDNSLLVATLRAAPFNGSVVGVFAYARAYEHDWQARMFAPAQGIVEDPATGSAAAAFGGALAAEAALHEGSLRWQLAQGLEMGRPSLLLIEADKRDGAVTAVRVGGHAVRVSEGLLYH